MIGVNDAWFAYHENSGSSPERYEKIYRLIIEETVRNNPDIKLILMEPFTGQYFSEQKRKNFFFEYVKELQPIVYDIAKSYNAIFVPLQDLFDSYSEIVPAQELIWDGVHPTVMGHELIARRWLEVVEKELK